MNFSYDKKLNNKTNYISLNPHNNILSIINKKFGKNNNKLKSPEVRIHFTFNFLL